MPWWGWALIGLAIVVAPIKLKIMKKMFQSKKEEETDDY